MICRKYAWPSNPTSQQATPTSEAPPLSTPSSLKTTQEKPTTIQTTPSELDKCDFKTLSSKTSKSNPQPIISTKLSSLKIMHINKEKREDTTSNDFISNELSYLF